MGSGRPAGRRPLQRRSPGCRAGLGWRTFRRPQSRRAALPPGVAGACRPRAANRTRARRRLRVLLIAVAAAAVVAIAATAVALVQRKNAEQQRLTATEQARLAVA